jgi:DNA-binding GntR family transcriptional regulator
MSESVVLPVAYCQGVNMRNATAFQSGSMASTPVLRPSSLVDDVYGAIYAQLMALKIAPGARITVDSLARELAVSQTPIREALGRLEGEGLVIKTHLVGYSAAPQITRERFEDLYELRLRLEPYAAGRAAARMTAEALDALTEAAGVMARRNGGADERVRYSQFARQDAEFHDLIVGLAGNALIRESLTHLHTHFHIFRLMFHARVTQEALEEHERILAAFAAADAVAAETAMREHIERSRDRLLPAFETLP